jgi:hypothetical protein
VNALKYLIVGNIVSKRRQTFDKPFNKPMVL